MSKNKIKIFRNHDREKLENEVNEFLSSNRYTIEQPVFLFSTCTCETTNGNAIIVHVMNSVCIAYIDHTAESPVKPDTMR